MDFFFADERYEILRIIGDKHISIARSAPDYGPIRISLKAEKHDMSREELSISCDLNKTETKALVNQKFHWQSRTNPHPSILPNAISLMSPEAACRVSPFLWSEAWSPTMRVSFAKNYD